MCTQWAEPKDPPNQREKKKQKHDVTLLNWNDLTSLSSAFEPN